MDLSKLTLGSKLVFGAGVLLLIDSFLDWQALGPFSWSMWHGWGVLVGLLLLAVLAWEGAQLAGMSISFGSLSASMLTAALAALLVLFTLIKVLTNDYVASWAWIGLVLTIVMAAGAWLNMQAAGESLSDLKSSVTAAASSATAAAKSATASQSGDSAASSAPAGEPDSEDTPGTGGPAS